MASKQLSYTGPMFSRRLAFILTVCLFWQSLAYAGAGVVLAHERDHEHALLHFEGAAHHHDHHEGDLHEDASTASFTHVAADAGLFAPALMWTPVLGFTKPAPDLPDTVIEAAHPLPFLDGLERPPRHTA